MALRVRKVPLDKFFMPDIRTDTHHVVVFSVCGRLKLWGSGVSAAWPTVDEGERVPGDMFVQGVRHERKDFTTQGFENQHNRGGRRRGFAVGAFRD